MNNQREHGEHGEMVEPGDEFNHDPMYFCAKCGYVHTRASGSCDGLRGGWNPGSPKTLADVIAKGNPLKPAPDPLEHQVAGDHYKKLKIQPIEYIHANGIPFAEGSVIKYVTRWRDKGGIKDLEKARHFLDLLIDLERRAVHPAQEPSTC